MEGKGEYSEHYMELLEILRRNMDKEPMTQDEAIMVWQEMHTLVSSIPEGNLLSCLYDHLTKELARGKRCGVCGRYENKDCWEDC